MYVLRAYIKLSIFENIYLKIKKIINIFLIFVNFFFKNVNYCVPLWHTLAKSFYFYSSKQNNVDLYFLCFSLFIPYSILECSKILSYF